MSEPEPCPQQCVCHGPGDVLAAFTAQWAIWLNDDGMTLTVIRRDDGERFTAPLSEFVKLMDAE